MKVPTQESSPVRFFESIYKPAVEEAKLRVPYSVLERGRAAITNVSQCPQYLAAYGGHHFHKLYVAFASWDFDRLEAKNIEIIDWGCGLAIATCVLIDYFIENRISPNIKLITLIERSLIALKTGREIIYQLFQTNELEDCEIRLIEREINDVKKDDLVSETSNVKIHLFSNIIDIPTFDLTNLHKLIVESFQGFNILVITSPFQNDRIDKFRDLFEQSHEFIKSFDSSEPVVGEVYSIANQRYQRDNVPRYEKQFAVNLSRD